MSDGFVVPRAWFKASDARMSQADLGGSTYGFKLADDPLISEIDAMTITRDTAKLGSGNASDGAVLMLSIDTQGKLWFENRALETLEERSGHFMRVTKTRRQPVFMLCLPTATTAWTAGNVRLFIPASGLKVWHNLAKSQDQEFDSTVTLADYMTDIATYEDALKPKMTVTAPASVTPGAEIDVTISVLGEDGNPDPTCASEIYVREIAGVAPFKIVQAASGVATVRLVAAYLRPGENLSARFGFRNWPGLATVSVPVTA